MTTLNIIGPGLDPDDLWRNYHYLERRLASLEQRVRLLKAELQEAREEFWEFEANEDK